MNETNDLAANAMIEDNKPECTNTSSRPPKMPIIRAAPKTGRNDPCICGNGRKFKKCYGRNV